MGAEKAGGSGTGGEEKLSDHGDPVAWYAGTLSVSDMEARRYNVPARSMGRIGFCLSYG